MPTEDDLRTLLASVDAPKPIDADAVIRRSRLRRLPAQLGVGAVGVLAVAGVGVLALPALTPPPHQTAMSEPAPALESNESADTGIQSLKRDPFAYLTCGATVPESTGSMYGLDAVFDGATFTITNASPDRVTGTFGVPSVTVTQDGVTVSHSGRAVIMIANMLDLAPGQSMQLPISVPTTACVPGEEEPGPDPLPPGDYEVIVSIDFVPDVPDPDLPALTDVVASEPTALRVG